MARHLEFNREEALQRATEVFWTKGYGATSMTDLEAATGLKPGSIYNAFDSKKSMFLQSIDHYNEQVVGERIQAVLNKGVPLKGIESFFRSTYEEIEPDQLIGCMLTNTATEIGNTDADIQESVAKGIHLIETAFQTRILEAQRSGEVSIEIDAKATALHLTSCYQGLCVIGRLTRDKSRLELITNAALEALRQQ